MRYLTVVASFCLAFSTHASSTMGGFADLEFVTYDERGYDFVSDNSQIEILASDLGWAEGPVWVKSLDSLLFSDVAADKVYRWSESDGLNPYLFPSGHLPDDGPHAWRGSNGLAIDRNDNLVLAQQGNRKVARMLKSLDDPAPDYQVLAERFQGGSLNSPNDLAVHPSGDIFFTDPPYGLSGFENSPDIELDFFGVFRLSKDGGLVPVLKSLGKPNGLAFSMDYSRLYVSNSDQDNPQIIVIHLDDRPGTKESSLFFDATELVSEGPGSTDGMAMHASGFLFASIPNGVGIFSPDGMLISKVALGQVTNLAFDDRFTYLYITTPNQLMRLELN